MITIGLLSMLLSSLTPAQQATNTYRFDVASIKVNKSGEDRVSGGFLPGGLYRVSNYPLRSLIAAAYLRPQVNPGFLIEGGPEWIDSTRFDIEARAAGEFPTAPDSPNAPRRVMLQNLLAERFGLKVHHETRQGDVYVVTFSRPDRKLGPQLQASSLDCVATPPTPSPCGVKLAPGSVIGNGLALTPLMNLLPRFVDRIVIDETALTGRFDYRLSWRPAPGEWMLPPSPDAATPREDAPSLFTALQEQLGLKLESRKDAIDILVVDQAEMPKPN